MVEQMNKEDTKETIKFLRTEIDTAEEELNDYIKEYQDRKKIWNMCLEALENYRERN